MGTDPETSVADPCGELHDTPGVWIGDGSAFPTVVGHQPDDLDHGARAPHRGGDRRAAGKAAAAGARATTKRRGDHDMDAIATRTAGRATSSTSAASGSIRVGRETIDVINASTEEVIGRIPQGTPEDVDRAVAAARAGFEAWSQTAVASAPRLLRAIAAGLAERGEEIAAPDRARARHADRPVAR